MKIKLLRSISIPIVIISIFLTGCGTGIKAEIETIKKENESLRKNLETQKNEISSLKEEIESKNIEIDELKYGADKLLNQAQELFNKKDYSKSKEILNTLNTKHPYSEEAKKSITLRAEVDKMIDKMNKEKAEAEKKRIEAEKAEAAKKEAAEKKRIQKATQNMRIKYDEVQDISWYHDKSSPQYNNVNGFQLYFGKTKSGSQSLRLRIQYFGDNWLFIKKYIFKIDGVSYEISPSDFDIKRDNGYSGVWEWYDTSVDSNIYDIVKAVIPASKTVIRSEGDTYYKDRVISQQEKQALQNVLDAYNALGGSLEF